MKLREVFRLELGYQVRRPWTWVYFLALFGLVLQITIEAYTANARIEGYFFNAPFVSAAMTLMASLMGLLVAAGFAGDAAARDVQLRMHPLLYTSSLGAGTFLAGRFLAAFTLTALILLAAPIAVAVSTLVPSIPTDLLFAVAALSRRAMAGYLGAVVIFFTAMSTWIYVAAKLGHWTLAKVADPMALTVISEIARTT